MKGPHQDSAVIQDLPPQADILFWDVDLTHIDLHKHRRFIITRLLTMGRPEHVRWVLRSYSRQEIIQAIKSSRNMDPKTANFWALYFEIPREQIRCFRKS